MRTRYKVPLLLLGFVIVLIGVSLAWMSYSLRARPLPADISADVQRVVDKFPHLKPRYDAAMSDGTLTWVEANEILGSVKE